MPKVQLFVPHHAAAADVRGWTACVPPRLRRCAMALVHSRIRRIVFALPAPDGAIGTREKSNLPGSSFFFFFAYY